MAGWGLARPNGLFDGEGYKEYKCNRSVSPGGICKRGRSLHKCMKPCTFRIVLACLASISVMGFNRISAIVVANFLMGVC